MLINREETTRNMNIIPVLLPVLWLLNGRVAMSLEPVVMLRQGTVRGVSVTQAGLFVTYGVDEVK